MQLDGQLTPSGLAGVSASAAVDLKPGGKPPAGKPNDGGIPVQGSLDIHYDQGARKLELGDSQLDVGSTHAGFSKCKNACVATPFFKCYFTWTITALLRT